jgi:hypothetical protein
MAETKREAVVVDGEMLEEHSELASSTEEAVDTEDVFEDELEIVDAGPDAPRERQDEAERAPEGAHASEPHSLPQPFHSTRGTAPGPRGCWAMSKRTGQPCSAAKRSDSDFCNAHTGIGIVQDPKGNSVKGALVKQERAALRAQMRILLGNTRTDTPRAALKAAATLNAKRIAGRAVDAILSPSTPDAKAAALAIQLVNTVDPPVQAEISVSGTIPQTNEELDAAFADGSILNLIRSGLLAPPPA